MVQTADGGYLIGGEVRPWRGEQSYGVFKLDGDGSVVWNANGRGPPVSSVAETAGGTVVAVGESGVLLLDPAGNILDGDVEADGILQSVVGTADGGFAVAGTTGEDLLVLKWDRDQTQEWQKTYGTGDQDSARAVIQTSDGGYLVSGTTYLPNRNGSDVWLLRLDAVGDLLWEATLGSPSQYPCSLHGRGTGGRMYRCLQQRNAGGGRLRSGWKRDRGEDAQCVGADHQNG